MIITFWRQMFSFFCRLPFLNSLTAITADRKPEDKDGQLGTAIDFLHRILAELIKDNRFRQRTSVD